MMSCSVFAFRLCVGVAGVFGGALGALVAATAAVGVALFVAALSVGALFAGCGGRFCTLGGIGRGGRCGGCPACRSVGGFARLAAALVAASLAAMCAARLIVVAVAALFATAGNLLGDGALRHGIAQEILD